MKIPDVAIGRACARPVGFAHPSLLIKSKFSRSFATGDRISDSRAAKGERGIWPRRYCEHSIRDKSDFRVDGIAASDRRSRGEVMGFVRAQPILRAKGIEP